MSLAAEHLAVADAEDERRCRSSRRRSRPARRRDDRDRVRAAHAARAPCARRSTSVVARRSHAPRRRGARRSRCRCRSRSARPCCSSSRRSATWFSMMPLWTTATLPATCGCAFASLGPPVRRPARVADAGRAGERRLRERRVEVVQLADRAHDLDGRARCGSRAPPSRTRGTRACGDPRPGAARTPDLRRIQRFRTWLGS